MIIVIRKSLFIQVEDILEKVGRAFSDNMAQVDWMDQATRNKAEEKLKFISPMIGYPDWILNVAKLDKYYENVSTRYRSTAGQESFSTHFTV